MDYIATYYQDQNDCLRWITQQLAMPPMTIAKASYWGQIQLLRSDPI